MDGLNDENQRNPHRARPIATANGWREASGKGAEGEEGKNQIPERPAAAAKGPTTVSPAS